MKPNQPLETNRRAASPLHDSGRRRSFTSIVVSKFTMPRVALLSLVLLGCLTSCAHDKYARGKYTRGYGDAGQFIIQRAVEYCGISAPTNALLDIGGKWRFSELEDDVLVILEWDRYPAVEAFLRCAFGEPSFGPEDTIDGHQLEGYRLTSSGGGIMLTSNDDNTEVLVIRPRKRVK